MKIMIRLYGQQWKILKCFDKYLNENVIILRSLHTSGKWYVVVIMPMYLVEEVDLCHCVGGLSRVFDQQCYEPHKGIQVVVTLGSDNSCTGCWVVLLLSLSPIAYLHTHFSAQSEEPCDQVIGLQDALLVHLQ